MTDLLAVFLIILLALRLVLEVIVRARGQHLAVGRLQEQAAARARAAHDQQVEEARRARFLFSNRERGER